jgi:hypothetical protein
VNKDEKAKELRLRMAAVRNDLRHDVTRMVDSARVMTNWRYYVKQFPWLSIAAATAVGFLLVPKRTQIIAPDADALEELAKRNRIVVSAGPKPEPAHDMSRKVLAVVGAAALRAAAAYLGQRSANHRGQAVSHR